jgi:PqqD family protein of HPr-rel-A system
MTQPLAKRTAIFNETAIEDEIVVMHLESGEFFSLTGSAAAIWQLIDGTRGRDQVLANLAAQFLQDEALIAADLDAFLAQLRAAGLVEG